MSQVLLESAQVLLPVYWRFHLGPLDLQFPEFGSELPGMGVKQDIYMFIGNFQIGQVQFKL